MSTRIFGNDRLNITRFCGLPSSEAEKLGGISRACLQITVPRATVGYDYIQLNQLDVQSILPVLQGFVEELGGSLAVADDQPSKAPVVHSLVHVFGLSNDLNHDTVGVFDDFEKACSFVPGSFQPADVPGTVEKLYFFKPDERDHERDYYYYILSTPLNHVENENSSVCGTCGAPLSRAWPLSPCDDCVKHYNDQLPKAYIVLCTTNKPSHTDIETVAVCMTMEKAREFIPSGFVEHTTQPGVFRCIDPDSSIQYSIETHTIAG